MKPGIRKKSIILFGAGALIGSSPRQVLNNVVGKCDKLHRRLINVEFLMVKTLHGFSFRVG